MAASTTVTVTATLDGVTLTQQVIVEPVGTPQGPVLGTLSVPSPLNAGDSGGGFVELDPRFPSAPEGGTVVTLTSSDPAALSVPSTVTIPFTNRVGTFTATAGAMTTQTTVTVTATLDGVSLTQQVVVEPTAPPPPPPPPGDTTTTTFTGEIGRRATVDHQIAVGAAGDLVIDLNWARRRSDIDIRVIAPSGAIVYTDTSQARPKTATVAVTETGTYAIELTNTTRRRTDYTLTVAHPA